MEWPRVALDQVAEFRGGSTPRRDESTYWNGDIPWVTPTDLPPHSAGIATVESAAQTITEDGLDACSASLLPAGTVVFSSRASIGKIGITAVPLATNQGFANLIPRAGIDSRYLAWCLHFNADNIAALAGSTTFREVTKTSLKRFCIPLPPLSEQRRIAEILDQADRLRRLRAEADEKAASILPALFLKMFGDPATNPMRWPTRPLRDLAVRISDGPFGSNLKSSHYVERGVRVLRLQNIGIGTLDDDDRAFVSRQHFSSLSQHRCVPGDVIVATLGRPNLRACILPAHIPEALNKADCVQIRPKPRTATAEYLCWLLNMQTTRRMAQRLVHGQTRARISMGLLSRLSVPIPEYDLQMRFASHAQITSRFAVKQEHLVRVLRRLCNVILQTAFNDRLTVPSQVGHMARNVEDTQHKQAIL